MSLSSTTSRNDYTGNGSVSTYSYNFKVFADTELKVTVRNLATPPVETVLTKGTDYTVTGVGVSSGGTIVLVNASQAWLTTGNLTTGYHLTVRRVRPLTQTTDIRNQGSFFAEIHEDTFDMLVMIDQQQQEQVDRTVKLPTTILSSTFDPTLPEDIGTPGATVVVNPAGTGFLTLPPNGGIVGLFGTPIQEAPAGAINSSNKVFTLSQIPISNASVTVYLNRLIMVQGTDYTISGLTVTLTGAPAPAVGQAIYAVYQH